MARAKKATKKKTKRKKAGRRKGAERAPPCPDRERTIRSLALQLAVGYLVRGSQQYSNPATGSVHVAVRPSPELAGRWGVHEAVRVLESVDGVMREVCAGVGGPEL